MKKNTEKNPYQTYGYTVNASEKKNNKATVSQVKGNDLRIGGKK